MKIKINDLNVNYIKEGSKDYSVLILEGWGTSIATYRPLIDSIKQYSTVYCFDMPGFGETDEPMESLNLDDYVNIAKFIDIWLRRMVWHTAHRRLILISATACKCKPQFSGCGMRIIKEHLIEITKPEK